MQWWRGEPACERGLRYFDAAQLCKMAKGTKALSAPAAVKNGPRGLEGQILTHLRSALHKVSIAGCSFLGPTCGLAITHDLGLPLILIRIEYCEH